MCWKSGTKKKNNFRIIVSTLITSDKILISIHRTATILCSRKHPAVCKLTDVDSDTGCKEFEIEKGRFSFRLTAPYREERRRAASEAAKNE